MTSWAPTIGIIRHDGEPWHPEASPNYSGRLLAGGAYEFLTSIGADEAAGTWEIEISEIHIASDTTGMVDTRVQGPWVLRVVVP